ncbi:MAG: TIGR04255 family protein [Candidatus Kapaibacterium sp.]
MTRKLPDSINPCPITEAIIEIRFETDTPSSVIAGRIYGLLLEFGFETTEVLPTAYMPEEFRKQIGDFKYLPHQKVFGDGFIYQVGPQMFSFSAVGDYPGWEIFKLETKKIFDIILFSTNLVQKVTRLAIRYISIFNRDVFPELDVIFNIGGDDCRKQTTFIRTHIVENSSNVTLTLNNGIVNNQDNSPGMLIDIDIERTTDLSDFNDNYIAFLDKMHQTEKETFFKLLPDEFVQTLNPKYP